MELKESLLLQTKPRNITVDYDVNLLQPTQLGMGLTGFEPVTLRLSSACSNQLSYRPGSLTPNKPPLQSTMVEAWGFEPQTYSLQSYRSTN